MHDRFRVSEKMFSLTLLLT